jgi:hypothetical protein
MTAREPRMMAIYVDRARPGHWIVRDREGRFWIVPPGEQPWDNRQPFEPIEDADLQPVPGHYGPMLGLPA